MCWTYDDERGWYNQPVDAASRRRAQERATIVADAKRKAKTARESRAVDREGVIDG